MEEELVGLRRGRIPPFALFIRKFCLLTCLWSFFRGRKIRVRQCGCCSITSRRRHTRSPGDCSSDVCSSDLPSIGGVGLLDDFTKSATLSFKAEGEAIL